MTPCGALRASSPSSTTVTTSSIWSWIRLFHFVLRFGCGDAFCTDTFLQTGDVTHRNLYREQFLRADILTHRSLCTFAFCTQTPLHTEVFTQRRKYLHTDALYKDAFARINKGTTYAFLHTEPFPQRSLCTEQFLHMFFLHEHNIWHRETCTHRLHTEVFTDRRFCMQKLYAEQFLHSRNFFAQKPLRTKTIIYTQQFLQTDRFYTQKVSESSPHRSLRHIRFLRKTFFTYRRFYTQMSLHTYGLHTETCAHRMPRLHTANFYTERLCFPLLKFDHGHDFHPFKTGTLCRNRLRYGASKIIWKLISMIFLLPCSN